MTALQLRQASQAVLNGQEFFRLFQLLESGGDIFEIDTGTKALCVGPQSDLSNYNVNFFDFQAPDNIDEVSLSLGNPIIGRLDALLATQYPTASGLPAGILLSSRDFVDNNWLPAGWTPPVFNFPDPPVGGDVIAARVIPKVDIFSYLRDPPAIAPLRDDRLYQFPFTVSLAPPWRFWWIMPYYGRRYGEFSFNNLSGGGLAQTYTINAMGVNLMPGVQDATGDTPGASKSIETTLFGGPIVVPPGSRSNRLIKSDTDGMFDLIAVNLVTDMGFSDINTVMQLLVSDRIG
jgi:hypothetical protein